MTISNLNADTKDTLDELLEFHWMMDMIQTVDVGIVVFNRQFEIKVWNGFMEAHSGLLPSDVRDKSLFSLYPEIQEKWLQAKTRPVLACAPVRLSLGNNVLICSNLETIVRLLAMPHTCIKTLYSPL